MKSVLAALARRLSGLASRKRAPLPSAATPAPQSPQASITLRQIEAGDPAHGLRALLWTLLALVGVLLFWALTARLDIVASAPGKLVPQSQVKVVQAAEPGIVRQILVRDGDRVQAGQVLIRKDTTLTGADASVLASELAFKRITIRAIDAALAGQLLPTQSDDPPLLFAQVNAQFTARRQALTDGLAQEEQAARRARHDKHAAVQVRDKLHETLPTYRQSADSFGRLHKDGFVGELMANEKKRELIERQQDLKAQEASLLALDAAIAQAQQRSTQLRSQFRSQLLTERVEAEAAVARLAQETAKTGFRAQQLEVRAPHTGTVQGMLTTTAGAVVQPGQVLLTIVPLGDALRAEAVLANEDAGFVELGQRVKVKLAAYPFQKYGMLEGTVVNLSADAVDADAAARATGASPYATPQLAYKAVIEIAAQALQLPGGAELKLAPGMAITAEIHQGRRTVMEYLLSPVQRVTATAARER